LIGKESILKLWFIPSLIIFAGCASVVKPPEDLAYEQIPSYAWDGLKKQRSFKFDYSIGRKTLVFSVAGSGSVVMPDALRFKGIWKLGEEEKVLDLVAAGDYELDKEDGQWLPHQRSEEARIVEQVDRIIRDALLVRNYKGFTLESDEGRTIKYSFKPNLAYLDPGFQKKFSGELIVDGRTLLAKEIKGFSNDSDIIFDFSIRGINQRRGIDMPYAPNFSVKYSLEEVGASNASRIIRSRLRELGRKSKIRVSQNQLTATLALPLDQALARSIAGEGRLYILGLNLEGIGERINTRGQVTDIFYIQDTVARPQISSVGLEFDSLSRPVINIALTKAEPTSRVFDYFGIVVDGVLYEVIPIDTKVDFIKIANVSTYQEALALIVKIRRPMKGSMTFLSEEKLR
jgi:hypothetical protein